MTRTLRPCLGCGTPADATPMPAPPQGGRAGLRNRRADPRRHLNPSTSSVHRAIRGVPSVDEPPRRRPARAWVRTEVCTRRAHTRTTVDRPDPRNHAVRHGCERFVGPAWIRTR